MPWTGCWQAKPVSRVRIKKRHPGGQTESGVYAEENSATFGDQTGGSHEEVFTDATPDYTPRGS